jgi:hypothetical protein
MSDIVERLRAYSEEGWPMMHKAADEIERLRAALEDCICGRKDWMEKAKRALEEKA